ncbi:hypothetical protein [Hymenobacter guriensis]|uniref:Uncharacterized protein n=1 Tax=Hymenobacter guriensis TaxID=2793065 RepID=A0ABS0L3C5_9BACT|nr:hypothetical protein [Hymenobacter guriensis]MBG8554617.1 hypothetical protein [Hymenobacter guriensis]
MNNAIIFQRAAQKANWQLPGLTYSSGVNNDAMRNCIRVVRQDGKRFEALSVPKEILGGTYYLISNDLLYELLPIPIKITHEK